jgi:uncharacterized protein YfaA (DUF2138 family)
MTVQVNNVLRTPKAPRGGIKLHPMDFARRVERVRYSGQRTLLAMTLQGRFVAFSATNVRFSQQTQRTERKMMTMASGTT